MLWRAQQLCWDVALAGHQRHRMITMQGVSETQGPFLLPQQLASDKHRAAPFKQLVLVKVSEKLLLVILFVPTLQMLRMLREQAMCLQQLGVPGVTHSSDDLQPCPPGWRARACMGRASLTLAHTHSAIHAGEGTRAYTALHPRGEGKRTRVSIQASHETCWPPGL